MHCNHRENDNNDDDHPARKSEQTTRLLLFYTSLRAVPKMLLASSMTDRQTDSCSCLTSCIQLDWLADKEVAAAATLALRSIGALLGTLTYVQRKSCGFYNVLRSHEIKKGNK